MGWRTTGEALKVPYLLQHEQLLFEVVKPSLVRLDILRLCC